ncbi:flagellar biosynthetic protein FliO [Thalassobacillus devorans]|uniref:flagellar biosynthetic protein FliO n=1 Tax=Thalassobacillus devorans TaxID=279813 RepID=UPI0004B30A22|nr:flagellar biosynthetic protein FliO [Thalassobacillus devorans]
MINRVLIFTLAILAAVIPVLSPNVVTARPSVIDCTENPGLEGCREGGSGAGEAPGDSEGQNNEAAPSNDSMAWNLVQLLFSLLLVLGLIYGLLKFFNRKNKMFQKNRKLENIGGLSLGPNRSLQLVRIGDRVLVIGVGENVKMVTEIKDETSKQNLMQADQEETLDDQLISRFFNKKDKKKPKTYQQSSSIQFQQLFEGELGDLKENRQRLLHNKKQREDYHDE